jgi:hypothetical protein
MAKHFIDLAPEMKLLGQALEPAATEHAAPRLKEFHEGIAEMRNVQSEISQLSKFTKKRGFSGCGNFQRVATIPVSVKAAIQEVIPDLFEDKTKFYALLNNNGPLAPYDVRDKIDLKV